jgi:short-subunit dehydrogenase
MELRSDNIRVVTVLPGVTASEFNDSFLRGAASSGTDHKVRRTGSLMGVMPSEKVARRIVKAIERSDREVYVALKDRLFVWGANLAPGLFEWAMIRFRKSRIGM